MDISQLSDEELLKLASPQQSISSLSDEELLRLAGNQPKVQEPITGKLEQQMTQEKSIKDKAIADAKLIKDPAQRDQALRDAMRLSIATSGEVSTDVKEATDYSATHGVPVKTYEGKTIGMNDVTEKPLVDVTLETVMPTGKLIGTGVLKQVEIDIIGQLNSRLGSISKGTEYLVNRIVAGLPEEEAIAKSNEIINLVSSIPEEHQAYALANMAEGQMGLDNIKKAIVNAKNDSELAAKLNNTLKDRQQIVQSITSGNSDVGAAQAKWSEMLKTVEEASPGQFSTEPLKSSLDYVSNIYGLEGTSKASQIVRQIKADTSEPTLSASQALNMRKGINELIRKASRGSRELRELDTIKSKLDNFIETTLPPEVNKLVSDTTAEYARVVNNKQFSEIITKNSNKDIGVDWSKVLVESKKAGLKSDEVTIATNIAKEFEKKFKYDKQLTNAALPRGVDEAQGGLMFFLTQVSNKIRDVAAPIYNRTRAENLRIQDEIVKSIKQGTSFTETLTGLAKNKSIPDEYRLGVFQKLADDLVPNNIDDIEPTIDNLMTANSRAHSEAEVSSKAKVTAKDTNSRIDEAVVASEQTGTSVDEALQKASLEKAKPVEGNSEYVTNMLAGKPEQLRTYDENIVELQKEGFQVGSRPLDDGTHVNFAVKDGDVYKVEYIDGNTKLSKLSDTSASIYKTLGFEEAKTLEQITPKPTELPIDSLKNSLQDQIGRNIVGTRRGNPIDTTIQDVNVTEHSRGLDITLKGDKHDIKFNVYNKGPNEYGFDSTELPKGGSVAYPLQRAGWDYIKSKGGTYSPDTMLTNANPFRNGLNMLRYANEKGWDNVGFIKIRGNQYGYKPEGLTSSRFTKPLTKENLKQFNKNLINGLVKDKLSLQNVNLKTMPEDKLNRVLATKLQGRNDLSLTPGAVKDLVRFMKEHSPRTMFGITPVLVMFDGKDAEANTSHEIKNYFSKIESGGDYNAENSSGAYGKYQIHPVMMKELGISKAYLKNPNNQEKVMDQLIPKYESRLKKFDIPVTKENMFVLHNLGTTGGVRVLKGNYTKEDIKNMAANLPDSFDKDDEKSIIYNYSTKYNINIPERRA